MVHSSPTRRVMVVSASMGGGHDGAARELARRIEERGHEAWTVDFLAALPFRLGYLLRWLYVLQLRYAGWTYEVTYRLWYVLPPLVLGAVGLNSALTSRRLRRWIEESRPHVVVSTYPLSSLVLGRLRRKGRLWVPTATFLTDFAAHPLWVHPGIDLHLAVHPSAAAEATQRTGAPALAPGPLVSPRFPAARSSRSAVRAALGLQPADRAVLVVAGSWGVGAVAATVEAVAASGRYVPIVVCGTDERLRRRLSGTGKAVVLGWTDDMPGLMAAADALIENAGGLTCMEALVAGLPVISYRPLPGHGRDNATAMAAAGVTRLAVSEAELMAILDEVAVPGLERARLQAAARRMLAGDAAVDVLALAEQAPAGAICLPQPHRGWRRPASAALAAMAVWWGLTAGTGVAAARGLGVARPPRPVGRMVYLGVRLDARGVSDPAVVAEVARLGASLIVDADAAEEQAPTLRRLTARGLDLANGGGGEGGRSRWPWRRAQHDVARAGAVIKQGTDREIREFVPDRRVDAFDQLLSRRHHERVVVADHDFDVAEPPPQLRPGRIYVLDGQDTSPADLVRALGELRLHAAQQGLVPAPLGQLR